MRVLEQVVDRAGAPMWMPGECADGTPIIVQGPGTRTLAGGMAVPPGGREWSTRFGKVQAVEVPGRLFKVILRTRGHHVGNLFDSPREFPRCSTEGESQKTAGGNYIDCVDYKGESGAALDTAESTWQGAPRRWEPKNLEGSVTTTVIGGRSAKITRTETVIQRGHMLEGNMLIRIVVEDTPVTIELALCRQPRGQTPLDIRVLCFLMDTLGVTILVKPPIHACLDENMEVWRNMAQNGVPQRREYGGRDPGVSKQREPSYTSTPISRRARGSFSHPRR